MQQSLNTNGTDATARPPCLQCRSTMMLARIAPYKEDYDRRTFECPKCEHVEHKIVKYK